MTGDFVGAHENQTERRNKGPVSDGKRGGVTSCARFSLQDLRLNNNTNLAKT